MVAGPLVRWPARIGPGTPRQSRQLTHRCLACDQTASVRSRAVGPLGPSAPPSEPTARGDLLPAFDGAQPTAHPRVPPEYTVLLWRRQEVIAAPAVASDGSTSPTDNCDRCIFADRVSGMAKLTWSLEIGR